jgi:hypothetical protein
VRAFAVLTVIMASTTLTCAAEDCGISWYWNGSKCQPLQTYAPEDRDFWTRYFPEKGYPACTPDGCCPPGFTIQDSICKPYRGR